MGGGPQSNTAAGALLSVHPIVADRVHRMHDVVRHLKAIAETVLEATRSLMLVSVEPRADRSWQACSTAPPIPYNH
jgi:hypothetical protein